MMSNFKIKTLFSSTGLSLVTLFIFLIQYVGVVGYEISYVKVAIMALMPIIFLCKAPFISKAFIWGGLYLLSVCGVALMHQYVRFSTIIYLGLFLFTSITFYNLIHSTKISINSFIKFLKFIIYIYTVFLILQQISLILGIKYFPLINLIGQPFLAIDRLPSFSMEPSHTARILTAVMFGYLKCNEYQRGSVISFKDLFSIEHKWVTIGFLWTMLTMGSGTAFIGIFIISFYFINRHSAVYVIPLLILILVIASQYEIKQLDRALRTSYATLSGDIETIRRADGSAAVRIIPIVNTFTDLNLTKAETWIGIGTTTVEYNETRWKRDDAKMAIIEQYGLLPYFISLIFIFQCFIRKIFSIETLIFLILLGASLSNIYYIWGILMLFGVIKYFEEKYNSCIEYDVGTSQ